MVFSSVFSGYKQAIRLGTMNPREPQGLTADWSPLGVQSHRASSRGGRGCVWPRDAPGYGVPGARAAGARGARPGLRGRTHHRRKQRGDGPTDGDGRWGHGAGPRRKGGHTKAPAYPLPPPPPRALPASPPLPRKRAGGLMLQAMGLNGVWSVDRLGLRRVGGPFGHVFPGTIRKKSAQRFQHPSSE